MCPRGQPLLKEGCRLRGAGVMGTPGTRQGQPGTPVVATSQRQATLLFSRRSFWSQEASWYFSLSNPGAKVEVLPCHTPVWTRAPPPRVSVPYQHMCLPGYMGRRFPGEDSSE